MKLTLTLLATVFVSLLVFGQKTITIPIPNALTVEEIDSKGIVKFYKFSGNTINFGKKSRKVIFPKNFKAIDTVHTKVFFDGYPGKLARTHLLLIGNRNSEEKVFYLDKNNNLDLSDDGPPIYTTKQDSFVDIFLNNKEYPEGKFGVRILFETQKDSARAEKLTQMFGVYRAREKGVKMLHASEWFNNKRLNNRIIKTTIEGDSVKIVLHDWTCDGLFNSPKDMYFIGGVSELFTPDKKTGSRVLGEDSIFNIPTNTVYQILEVARDGSSIKIQKSDRAVIKLTASGDVAPNIVVKNFKGESFPITSVFEPGKYLVLDAWGSWCAGCKLGAPKLRKLYDEHKDKVQIIGLNYGDTPKMRATFFEKFPQPWLQFNLSEQFIEAYVINAYPTYILIDPSGKIVSLASSPEEIIELMK